MESEFTQEKLALGLRALALFRTLLDDAVVGGLLRVLEGADGPLARRTDDYCAFVAALYGEGGDLGAALLKKVLESENAAVRLRAKGQALPAEMAACLEKELALFSALSALDPAALALLAGGGEWLPACRSTASDFAAVYRQRLQEIGSKGYGVFAAHHMFTLGPGGAMLPVKNPDPQRLDQLTGYAAEREKVVLNTKALLAGLPANNILLYGDAGTGKSSTVKAIGNEYAGAGLRLVEVRKNQLFQIPGLMDALAENPLKFVLFIDDLSFPADDEDFTALKAILEGNISARPRNIVVYATSNRRHMVRQRHADRQGDDVHLSDTLQEQASLAARFGLTVTFLRPDREVYAGIVQGLAAEYGLQTPTETLLAQAEAHALRYGGRSPRIARQFVEYMKAMETVG